MTSVRTHRLRTPLTVDDLADLRAGDVVELSGTVWTARDAAHARIADAIERGDDLPFDPDGQALYFTGPAPARPGHALGPAGPTTASRMDPFSPLLIARGLRLMIGKGLRNDAVRDAMREHGCVYCSAVEGAAALLADRVTAADVVAYADLGPEAVHRLQVDAFPVTVVNDLHGGDLYEQGRRRWRSGGTGTDDRPAGPEHRSMADAGLPLAGVRVVTVEQAIAAPLCTRHLADLGADVVKVERPGTGDFARHYDATVEGLSSHFVWVNRGKRSVCLDLKADDGAEVFAQLVGRADVLVSNLGPGAMDRLGYGRDAVRAAHPALVCCAVSGYGGDGPYREARAYDVLLQAETGLLSITGTPEVPSKAGIPVADIAAGMYAFSSILAALLRRATTGEGAFCDISLLESLAEWMGYPLHYTRGGGTQPTRSGARHAAIAPYGPFATADDVVVVISVQNAREWRRLCEGVLDRPDLVDDERFATNPARVEHRDDLRAAIAEVFGALDADALEARLTDHAIAHGRQRDVAGLAAHPQLAARGRWRPVATTAGEVDALLPPLSVGAELVMGAVPGLGEHTDEVLTELGFAPDRIAALRAVDVVA